MQVDKQLVMSTLNELPKLQRLNLLEDFLLLRDADMLKIAELLELRQLKASLLSILHAFMSPFNASDASRCVGILHKSYMHLTKYCLRERHLHFPWLVCLNKHILHLSSLDPR